MLNVKKLKGAMAEAEVTQKDIANAISKSENTVTKRFKGDGSFDIDEAEIICALIGVTDNAQKAEIFLSASSQKRDEHKED
ncbi:MAG: helix-turn-helix transcriptional regulator [Clostridia bacterium]|nr:helix-turn-helix transcriptional regulator [Clostridia bacterium]